jgi:hypothetical protein
LDNHFPASEDLSLYKALSPRVWFFLQKFWPKCYISRLITAAGRLVISPDL